MGIWPSFFPCIISTPMQSQKSINLDFLERRTTFLLLLRFYLSILDFKFCSEFSMLMLVTQKTLHELLIRNFKKKILKSCTAPYFGPCTCT